MRNSALLDRLVLQYLEKRRYSTTQQALRQEAGAAITDMTLAPQISSKGIVEDLLFYIVAENDPVQYGRSFDTFTKWVDNSLDLFRHELTRVLFPVFIHCCLKLVGNGAGGEATQLIARHSQRFTLVGGQPSKVRMQELNELQTLSVPEHLATNRMAQAALAMRYPVKLCAYSYEMLTSFLQGAKLFLILGILNEYVNIQVLDGQSGLTEADDEEEVSLLTGQMQSEVATGQLSELNLGLLRGLAEDRYVEMQAAAQTDKVPEVDVDGKQLTKKERTALQRAMQRERESRSTLIAGRIEPEIPLPSLTEEELAEQLEDIEKRVQLSAAALPSTAFYTFYNTHQALNCVNFSRTGNLIAGGFADASVRTYDLQGAADQNSQHSSDADMPGSEVTLLRGHSAAVYGIDYSHDGRLLFTSSGDATVRLWSTELKACMVAYRGHNYPVWDIAAGPFGTYFASASADRTARIWCTERSQPLRILAGHHSDVDVVMWHPNGHYLASGSTDHTVRLWDIRDGKMQRVLIGHRAAVTALAFSPDGGQLSSADEDGVIITWDLAEAKKLASAAKHAGAVWSLAYSQGDGGLLASGGSDNAVKLWSMTGHDAEGAALQLAKTYMTKSTPVFHVQFSPRNLLLGSGSLTLGKRRK